MEWDAKIELVHYHDTTAKFLLPTDQISCATQHHNGEGGFPVSTLCQSSLSTECTKVVFIPTLTASTQTGTWWSCKTKIHTWSTALFSISACWGPTIMHVTLHWHAAIFELIVPLMNFFYAHVTCRKPTESSKWFAIRYCLVYGKIESNTAFKVFNHFMKMKSSECCIHSLSHKWTASN